MQSEDIEGQGFIFNFFNYLWVKDPLNKDAKVQVNIPDTIMFKLGKPMLWYFTNSEGIVTRKSKDRLNIEKIENYFITNEPQCQIVAYFVHIKYNAQEHEELEFEFFNKPNFIKFIRTKNFSLRGYLQRFIQPKGEKNFIIKVVWGPQMCFFEKHENNRKINDYKFDVYQRAICTESTRSSTSIESLKGKVLPQKIEILCDHIYQHILNITHFKKSIIHMELNFKVDVNNKIYLLFCQALKASIKKPLYSDTSVEWHLPQSMNEINLPVPIPLDLTRSIQCAKCQEFIDKYNTYHMNISMILKACMAENDNFLNAQSGSKNDKDQFKTMYDEQKINTFEIPKNYQIPKILRDLYPKMTIDDLKDYQNNPSYNVNKIILCQECYLGILDYSEKGQTLESLSRFYKMKYNNSKNFTPIKKECLYFTRIKNQKNIPSEIRNKTLGNKSYSSSDLEQSSSSISIQPRIFKKEALHHNRSIKQLKTYDNIQPVLNALKYQYSDCFCHEKLTEQYKSYSKQQNNVTYSELQDSKLNTQDSQVGNGDIKHVYTCNPKIYQPLTPSTAGMRKRIKFLLSKPQSQKQIRILSDKNEQKNIADGLKISSIQNNKKFRYLSKEDSKYNYRGIISLQQLINKKNTKI